MFSPQIVDTDAFLDMSSSAQNLYFHLGMRADDDGFVGNPKKILKMVGGNDDDLKILLAKRFVLSFESGVIVIKHWRINNLVRKDWYKPTRYLEEKSTLFLKENGSYTLNETQGNIIVNETAPESLTKLTHRLGKVRLGKEDIVAEATIFDFKEKMAQMKIAKDRRMLIIAYYWYFKEWKFDNEKQYRAALKRELRSATSLVGYTIKQVASAMEYCAKEYPVWTLETCQKRIDDLVNKK